MEIRVLGCRNADNLRIPMLTKHGKHGKLELADFQVCLFYSLVPQQPSVSFQKVERSICECKPNRDTPRNTLLRTYTYSSFDEFVDHTMDSIFIYTADVTASSFSIALFNTVVYA